jgi:signal peptidase I
MSESAPENGAPSSELNETPPTAPVEPTSEETEPKVVTTPAKPSRVSRFRSGALKHITELPMLVFLAFLIAIVIKTFIVQAFYIPSGSMIPTLRIGDRVLVEKLSYRLHDVRRGDVVVFEKEVFGAKPPDVPWYDDARNFFRELLGLPTGEEEDYIKRVVAVGGDTIRYAGSPRKLIVNGESVDISYVKGGKDRFSSTVTEDDCKRLEMAPAEGGCRVPAGRIFVMGDNRASSEDSRILGPIDEDKVVGRAFTVIWPPGHFGGL